MVQAKAKRRSRAKAPSDAERIEREYRRLALAIGDIEEFRLYLATYNDPRRRDELIDRLVTDAERQKLKVTRLDVSGCDREVSLVRLLREHLEETAGSSGWRRAVMVVGIEGLLDYADAREGLAVLETVNLQRDAFPEAVPAPVVFWLTPLASSAFPKAAPDLWHWRGATFDFTGHTDSRADILLDMITPPNVPAKHPSPRVREQAGMLEDLIAELDGGRLPKSMGGALKAAELLKSTNESLALAELLTRLGLAYIDSYRFSDALPVLERVLKIARCTGLRRVEGLALASLGDVYANLADPQQAIAFYQQAVQIAHGTGDGRLEAMALAGLGDLYRNVADPRQAIDHYQRVLRIAGDAGERTLEARALYGLGRAYRDVHKPQRALEHYHGALELARETGDQALEGSTLCDLGDLAEPQQAIEHYERALKIARESGNRALEGRVLFSLAVSHLLLGEPQRAIEHCERALSIAREIGDRALMGRIQAIMAFNCLELGNPQNAIYHFEQALEIAHELGKREIEARILYNLGDAYVDLGERHRAMEVLREALVIAEEIGAADRAHLARAKLAEWEKELTKI
jgi:tetratricopeptide (TPR) repeat protein